jgi:acetyltransferase
VFTFAGYRQAAISGIFDPRRVVVLGASAQRRASGNEAIRNLILEAFPTPGIEIVHPTAERIEGLPVAAAVADLDPRPDVALVSLPARALLGTLRELEAIGTGAAIVPTAGLDADTQHALEDFAAASEMAVHGNNCMGILSFVGGAPLWFYEGGLSGLASGGISLVSQSGSAIFLARAVEHAGFARVVSTGNEIDLSSPDYLTWLANDPATSVVGLVAESIRDEAAFTAAVGALRAAGKPLVALKVGRTEAGRRATLAHTGALVSSSAAVSDYFRALDVPLVDDYDQLAVALEVLAQGVRPSGPRIAVVTDSGGEAALAADLAEDAGIVLPAFAPTTVRRLEALMHGETVNNPLDAGSSPATTDEEYDQAYGVAAEDPDIDSIMIIFEGHGAVSDEQAQGVGDMLGTSMRRAAAVGKPVLAASSSSTATHPSMPGILGVPVARGITNALVALTAAAGNRKPLPVLPPRPADLPDRAVVDILTRRIRANDGRQLSQELAREVLGVYGIRLVGSFVARTADDAAAWAKGRYPVVAKVSSSQIAHRSDLGGVVTAISDEGALREAFDRIGASVHAHRPDLEIDGIEIQEQIGAATEAIVGLVSDTALGASVVIGVGGVLVELLDDAVSRRVPVDADSAAELIGATALGRLLAGYRGMHPVTPTEELVGVIARLSWLGHDLRGIVSEVDLNPVLIEDASGRVALVDALVVRAENGADE